jgi:hypothetical protein
MTTTTHTPTPSHPLLDRLWTTYVAEVPYAARFTELAGGRFENDHIALRTLARPGSGIAMFANVFEKLGWKHGGDYTFVDTHLRAVHLSQPGLPRIFISELDATALPSGARAALERLPADAPPPDDIEALAAWFRAPSSAPSSADLAVAHGASQYGAWLLAFGRKVNHFTASVDDVEAWQARLLKDGVPMKSDIEGARGGSLRQTATHAASLPVATSDGTIEPRPYAYFEIAERHGGFDGFLAPQARQLFDMTAT